MGRKRINSEEKKIPFNLSITKSTIQQLKAEAEKKGEIPSNIIEELIKKYLLKENEK